MWIWALNSGISDRGSIPAQSVTVWIFGCRSIQMSLFQDHYKGIEKWYDYTKVGWGWLLLLLVHIHIKYLSLTTNKQTTSLCRLWKQDWDIPLEYVFFRLNKMLPFKTSKYFLYYSGISSSSFHLLYCCDAMSKHSRDPTNTVTKKQPCSIGWWRSQKGFYFEVFTN